MVDEVEKDGAWTRLGLPNGIRFSSSMISLLELGWGFDLYFARLLIRGFEQQRTRRNAKEPVIFNCKTHCSIIVEENYLF